MGIMGTVMGTEIVMVVDRELSLLVLLMATGLPITEVQLMEMEVII